MKQLWAWIVRVFGRTEPSHDDEAASAQVGELAQQHRAAIHDAAVELRRHRVLTPEAARRAQQLVRDRR